jgi:hypothetical protein
MPGQKPHSISPDFSIRRALLRLLALKMAAWSTAILKKLAPDDPAASPDQAVDLPASQTADVWPSEMDHPVGPIVSKGPPKHWIERVRQGAPELLRPAPQRGNQPLSPGAGKGCSLQLARNAAASTGKSTAPKPPVLRSEIPAGAPEKNGSAYRIGPPPAKESTRLTRSASAAQSIPSIGHRESRVQINAGGIPALPQFIDALAHEEESHPRPDQSGLFSPYPPGTERVRLTTFPTERSQPPSEIPCGSGVPSNPVPGSVLPNSRSGQEPTDEHWPELPEIPSDRSNDLRSLLRERERLRRLDNEQRGIYGARRILA